MVDVKLGPVRARGPWLVAGCPSAPLAAHTMAGRSAPGGCRLTPHAAGATSSWRPSCSGRRRRCRGSWGRAGRRAIQVSSAAGQAGRRRGLLPSAAAHSGNTTTRGGAPTRKGKGRTTSTRAAVQPRQHLRANKVTPIACPCPGSRPRSRTWVPHCVQQWPLGLGAGAFGGAPLGEARFFGFDCSAAVAGTPWPMARLCMCCMAAAADARLPAPAHGAAAGTSVHSTRSRAARRATRCRGCPQGRGACRVQGGWCGGVVAAVQGVPMPPALPPLTPFPAPPTHTCDGSGMHGRDAPSVLAGRASAYAALGTGAAAPDGSGGTPPPAAARARCWS